MIEAWFDGGCGPKNPGGFATWGYVIKENGKTLDRACGCIGYGQGMTNNVAEHAAAFSALQWLLVNGYAMEKVLIRGDSLMVIKQLSGKMRASKKRPYFPFYRKAMKVLEWFEDICFEWVPREKNWEADELAGSARMLQEGPGMAVVGPGVLR